MSSLFYKVYISLVSKKHFFLGAVILVGALLAYNISNINLEEDIAKLIPQNKETEKLQKVLSHTNFADDIVVLVNSKTNQEKLIEFTDRLVDSINLNGQPYIKSFRSKVNDSDIQDTFEFIYNHLPSFLDHTDLAYLEARITVADSIKNTVANNYKTLITPSGILAKQNIRKDPFGLGLRALNKFKDLKVGDNFELLNNYIASKDHQQILLFIEPKYATNESDVNSIFIDELRRTSAKLVKEYSQEISVDFYGSTVISVSNARQIKHDITNTVTIALVILLLVLIYFYKRVWMPLVLFVPSAIGGLVAINALIWLRPSISAISLGIGSILLGITLDYALHIATHRKKSRHVKALYLDMVKPILMSAVTTAIAFLCLTLLNSQALQDLGIFAAISVIVSSVFALIWIPLMVIKPQREVIVKTTLLEKLASLDFEKFNLSKIIVSILLIVALFFAKKVSFNNDLNSMNYRSNDVILTEEKLNRFLDLNKKSLYVVAYHRNLDTVLQTNRALYKVLDSLSDLRKIARFSSNANLVLSTQEQKHRLAQWQNFWEAHKSTFLNNQLSFYAQNMGFNPKVYQPFDSLLKSDFQVISYKDYQSVPTLLTTQFIQDHPKLSTASTMVKIDSLVLKKDLKEAIANIPNSILIDRQEVNSIFLSGLKTNFEQLINYSFIAVFILIFLFFKRIELTLITIIPIALTWFFTLGLMGVFNIEFTIFNVIISTFIFGLGVDYSIFMTNGLIQDYTYGSSKRTTYKTSIVLSVITTLLGIGALIFAKHPALRSIALLSILGISVTFLSVFIVQPLIFRWMVLHRVSKGLAPMRLRTMVHSFLLLSVYSLGGMLLSAFSFTILKVLPISKKKKYKWVHKVAAKLVTLVLYGNPFVKKKVVNPRGETFDKPAIIIANHASALDTLTMGLLTHKLIYLVNEWVYKSPVFGLLARALGFYPVAHGVDQSTDHLKEKVRQGYSLVVFPEGKRSLTNKLGRFHKGAFFLQEQLQIDILPIYLHGNAEVMPKKDMIIYDGALTVVVGERIVYGRDNFGATYKERTKKISKFYKNNFQKLRLEFEDENYFKQILFKLT